MAAFLKSVFVDVYRLDYHELLGLLAAATVLFLLLNSRFRNKHWWKIAVVAVLTAVTVLVVYMTVGSRGGEYTGQYNLMPFHSYREVLAGGNPEIYRSNFMNAVLFYPSGLLLTALLPEKWRGWCQCVLVVVLFAALSAGIEYMQFCFGLGRCEIDDVIHNTAGALAGSLAALWMPSLLVWLNGQVKRMWAQYDHYRK